MIFSKVPTSKGKQTVQGMLINRLQVWKKKFLLLKPDLEGSFQRDAPLQESGQNLIGFAKWRVLVGNICDDPNGATIMSLTTLTIIYN